MHCTTSPEQFTQAFERMRCTPQFNLNAEWLYVRVPQQIAYVMQGDCVVDTYAVSTARNGVGCEQSSHKTPIGLHRIAQKIGGQCRLGEIIKAREPTGCVASMSTSQTPTGEDLITSRVLWLQGLEQGVNCGDGVDSFERYIYIHGTHEEGLIGLPVSKGCIRMKNKDAIALYNRVDENTRVLIDND